MDEIGKTDAAVEFVVVIAATVKKVFSHLIDSWNTNCIAEPENKI